MSIGERDPVTADEQPTAELMLAELTDDPFADDLAEQLAARQPRRIATRTTAVLAAIALATGGFAAGAQVQKRYGGAPAAAQNAPAGTGGQAPGAGNGGGQRRGGAGPGASASAAPAAGAPLTGTVKLVDGTTVYVETPDGQVVTVRTDGGTAVQAVQPGALKDLAAGATVTVEGSRNGDSLTATKITKTK
jgi:hypothetical protein